MPGVGLLLAITLLLVQQGIVVGAFLSLTVPLPGLPSLGAGFASLEVSDTSARCPFGMLTRSAWARGCAEKSKTWEAGSLPDMVSNLVKNWEKEASYKLKTSEWRTIDPIKYRFSCNGGPEVHLTCT